jgi:hypothetical protein
MMNYILGVIAAVIWFGAISWHFRRDFRWAFDRYRRRWTRLD